MHKYQATIVKQYVALLLEFINRMYLSDVFCRLSEPDKIIYNGFNVIQHVFDYANSKTNNLENSFYLCQQACNYYCEYIEQIYDSNLVHNLNHNDAIIFVYKKTIFELYNENPSVELGLTNSMYLMQQVNKDNTGDITSKIVRICHEIMYWDNNYTIEQRKFLCEYYLPKLLAQQKYFHWFVENICLLKNKFSFDYSDYTLLLDEMLKYIKVYKNVHNSDDIILQFYGNQDIIEKSFIKKNIPQIVKVLVFH